MTKTEFPESLRITRILPAPPAEVFAAWTDPRSLAVWMCPGTVREAMAEVELRVGGRFRIVMKHSGEDFVHTGEYLEVSPPHRLVFTWISKATHGRTTTVTIELRPHGRGETEIVMTHEGLPGETRAEHSSGWGQIVQKLEAHLRGSRS